ncbi:MAG: hypothetical protein QUS35_12175 [bacterium]|nr:hypothetical protein [bacterium]
MSSRARHRMEFGFAGIAAAGLFVLLRVNLAAERADLDAIHCYGGRLSASDRSALESLNSDLHHASDVEDIDSRGIRIRRRSGEIREYRLTGETLRMDGEPVLRGIRSFHFEYRDCAGGLLTLRSQNLGHVRSVGYVIRMESRGSEITVRSGSEMPFHAPHEEYAIHWGGAAD